MEVDPKVGRIEEEIQILVTVHSRSEMQSLKDAYSELGFELTEELLLDGLRWIKENECAND